MASTHQIMSGDMFPTVKNDLSPRELFFKDHRPATHFSEDAQWLAVGMEQACNCLEGYNLTIQEEIELPALMAGYCRLLDEAGHLHYGDTEAEAIEALAVQLGYDSEFRKIGRAE